MRRRSWASRSDDRGLIPDQGGGERWPMMNRTASRRRLHAARARLAGLPESVWAPLAGAALMVLPAAVGLVLGKPWLFPSLGPTVFVHVTMPRSPAARLYNTLVGHLIGIAAAVMAVAMLGAAVEPSVLGSGHLLSRRAWASVLAVVLTLLSQELLKAQHAGRGDHDAHHARRVQGGLVRRRDDRCRRAARRAPRRARASGAYPAFARALMLPGWLIDRTPCAGPSRAT
jgi:hypothetical protein